MLREAGIPVARASDLVSAIHLRRARQVLAGAIVHSQDHPVLELPAPSVKASGLVTTPPVIVTARPAAPTVSVPPRPPKQRPEAKRDPVAYLSEEDALRIHNALVKLFANEGDPIVPSGPREGGLLASALHRPQTGLGGQDKYRTIPHKGAALFHSLVKNHAFHNGNKRTALVATLTFFDRNGLRLTNDVSDDELFDFITAVASNDFPTPGTHVPVDDVVDAISAWWRERLVSRQFSLKSMTAKEFIDACEHAGARVVNRGESIKVQGVNGKAISFSSAVRKFAGGVVKNYASRLGLAGSQVGLGVDEFQEGSYEDTQLLKRFMTLLRRLASA